MELLAFDDLADAAAVQSNLCGYLVERQPASLSLGKRLAAGTACCLGFGLIAILGGTDRLAEDVLGVGGHAVRTLAAVAALTTHAGVEVG